MIFTLAVVRYTPERTRGLRILPENDVSDDLPRRIDVRPVQASFGSHP